MPLLKVENLPHQEPFDQSYCRQIFGHLWFPVLLLTEHVIKSSKIQQIDAGYSNFEELKFEKIESTALDVCYNNIILHEVKR